MKQKGITLIEMSEAGKTTLGSILAKKLRWLVYDVDEIIKKEQGKNLVGEILQEHGQEYLLELETKCIMNLELYESILVTPGSIIYDADCHKRLKERTTIVWLDAPLEVLKARFGQDAARKGRAVVGIKDGFEALFRERRPLYEKLADIRIDPGILSPNMLAEEIVKRLSL